MKKILKFFLIIILFIIILLIINFTRNTLLINNLRELGKKTLETYPEKVTTITNFNNEEFIGAVDKIWDITPEDISIFDIIFHVTLLTDNYYIIKNRDIRMYVNKDTGIIYKQTVEKMNAETIYLTY